MAEAGRDRQKRILDRGALAGQLLDHREAVERRGRLVIAALVAEQKPAAAQRLRRFLDQARHRPKAIGMEHHPGERIVEAGVETTRDDDEIRSEATERWKDDALEGGEIGADAAARRHGNVE